MRTRSIGGAVAGGVVAGFLAMEAAAGWACTPSSNVFAGPDAGVPAAKTSITGSLWRPATVTIRWNGLTGPVLGTAQGPAFSVSVTIPADAPPNVYYIVATQPDGVGGIRFTSAPFTVQGSITGTATAGTGATFGSTSGAIPGGTSGPAPVAPSEPAPVIPAEPAPVTPPAPPPATPAEPAPVTPNVPAPVTPAEPAPVTPTPPPAVTSGQPAPVTPGEPAPATTGKPAPGAAPVATPADGGPSSTPGAGAPPSAAAAPDRPGLIAAPAGSAAAMVGADTTASRAPGTGPGVDSSRRLPGSGSAAAAPSTPAGDAGASPIRPPGLAVTANDVWSGVAPGHAGLGSGLRDGADSTADASPLGMALFVTGMTAAGLAGAAWLLRRRRVLADTVRRR